MNNDTLDIGKCYAIPYGVPGLISQLLSLYAIYQVLNSRSPLWPSRTLRRPHLNLGLAWVQILACDGLWLNTFRQCGPGDLRILAMMACMLLSFVPMTSLPSTTMLIWLRSSSKWLPPKRQVAWTLGLRFNLVDVEGGGGGGKKKNHTLSREQQPGGDDTSRFLTTKNESGDSGANIIPSDEFELEDNADDETAPLKPNGNHDNHHNDHDESNDDILLRPETDPTQFPIRKLLLAESGDSDSDSDIETDIDTDSSTTSSSTTHDEDEDGKHIRGYNPGRRLPPLHKAIGTYLSFLPIVVYIMVGTYWGLQTFHTPPSPSASSSSPSSSSSSTLAAAFSEQTKAIWIILYGIYGIGILVFFLGPVLVISRRIQNSGWKRGLSLQVLARAFGFWHQRVKTAETTRYALRIPRPVRAAAIAGLLTLFLSNWVLALAAGGNWGFPIRTPGGEEGKTGLGLVVTYWSYFVVSRLTLFSM